VKDDLYYFDEEAAQRPVDWIESFITYPDGLTAGELLKLEDFQKEIIREAFGWKRKKDHKRRYSIVYVEIPRGNAKSTLVTALCLYVLVGEGEKSCEVYCCAGSRAQARKVFHPAKVMVTQSPELSSVLKVYDHSIVDKDTYGKMEVIAADAEKQHGHKSNFIAFDELHVQPNAELFDAMRSSMTKKPQPMMFILTTAGLINTFAEEIHKYAVSVREGIIAAPHWLVKIYAAGIGDDPFDPEVWKKANPGWKFINQDEFLNEANEAETNPIRLNQFKRLHLNIWTGAQEAFIGIEMWDRCNFGRISTGRKRTCYLGLDFASTRDISALALLFPPDDEDGKFDLKLYGWCPSDTIRDRELNENVNYPDWVRSGWINAVPGNVTEIDPLHDLIMEIHNTQDLAGFGYDRRFLTQLVIELERDGIECNPVAQNCATLHEPLEWFYNQILAGKINHEGNPVFRWMIGNLVTYTDTGGMKRPDKKYSRDKIDYVAATVMSIHMYLESKKVDNSDSFLTSGSLL
jgi:phage terminase large subunit-like protein